MTNDQPTEHADTGPFAALISPHRLWAAVAGLLAAGAALATGELFSGFSRRIPSLLVAIFDVLVDYSPNGVVSWSRETFGTNQKTVTVTGITVLTLVLGAVFGAAARKNIRLGVAGFGVFGIAGAWAVARSPLASVPLALLSAAATIAVGIGVLVLLLRTLPFVPSAAALPQRLTSTSERRRFLGVAAVAAFWGAFGTGMGRILRQNQSVEADRERVATALAERLPTETPAPTVGTDAGSLTTPVGDPERLDDTVEGISTLVTENSEFYRIDTALRVPQVPVDDWTLTIKGMVDQEIVLNFDDLVEMTELDEHVTLSCVSNEVGGHLIGNARWTGVALSSLLDLAGVKSGATQIVGRSVDDWTAGFPTEVAYDGRPAMVAITMNGEPLPTAHGFPARLVVPGLYGYVSATKWLKEIELTTWEDFNGYWIPRGWSKSGPIKTQSRIDVPKSGAKIAPGPTPIAGVAWAGKRSVDAVEVRVGEGDWMQATLSEELSESSWRQWLVEWDAKPGLHNVEVRATDGDGQVQTVDRAQPSPSGATGHHSIQVFVEG
jgi:DMSO/TMAO reductase YedYZ molybdopterin-dependent catalytic subunit